MEKFKEVLEDIGGLCSFFTSGYSKFSVNKMFNDMSNEIVELRLKLAATLDEVDYLKSKVYAEVENTVERKEDNDEVSKFEEELSKLKKEVVRLNGDIGSNKKALANRDKSITRLNDTISKLKKDKANIIGENKAKLRKISKDHSKELAGLSKECADRILKMGSNTKVPKKSTSSKVKNSDNPSRKVTGKGDEHVIGSRMFTCDEVKAIRSRISNKEVDQKDLAKELNVVVSTINRIVSGKVYKDCK